LNSGDQPPFHMYVRIRFKSEFQKLRYFVRSHFFYLGWYNNVPKTLARTKLYFHGFRHSSDIWWLWGTLQICCGPADHEAYSEALPAQPPCLRWSPDTSDAVTNAFDGILRWNPEASHAVSNPVMRTLDIHCVRCQGMLQM
jgi:hypothetical protein